MHRPNSLGDLPGFSLCTEHMRTQVIHGNGDSGKWCLRNTTLRNTTLRNTTFRKHHFPETPVCTAVHRLYRPCSEHHRKPRGLVWESACAERYPQTPIPRMVILEIGVCGVALAQHHFPQSGVSGKWCSPVCTAVHRPITGLNAHAE